MPRVHPLTHLCAHCGRTYQSLKSRQTYCSNPCRWASQVVDVHVRFQAKVVAGPNDCLDWIGARTSDGYGSFNAGQGRSAKAHTLAYAWRFGDVPEGLELDHLCRRRQCVNPEHLEPVAHRVNILRGESPPSIAAARTACINGHPFDEANTKVTAERRRCLTCRRDQQARKRASMTEDERERHRGYWRAYEERNREARRHRGRTVCVVPPGEAT
jgi:hypothetical protein